MALSQRTKIVALLASAVLALMALAAGLPGLQLRPGQALPIGALLAALRQMQSPYGAMWSLPFDPLRLIAALLWLALITTVVLFIFSPAARREILKRTIIYLLWGLIFYGLLQLVGPMLALPPPAGEAVSGGDALFDAADDEPLPTPPRFVVDPPGWLTALVSVLCVAAPLALGWLTWRLLRPPPLPAPEEATPAELADSARAALESLAAGDDVQNTILRCYRDMSQALARSRNLHRPQGMTPREFEQHLAEHGLHTDDIGRLTRLFEQARYGSSAPGRRAEREAVDCLSAIVSRYGRQT
ncbi:MAG: hypothetical protein Kow0031_04930 [Anaerolineae bacterium]